jgi:hypothetical protein
MPAFARAACALLLASCATPPPTPALAATADTWQRAPLGVIRPSFFHAALLVPPMQSAETVATGTAVGLLSTSHANASAIRTIDGVTSAFYGGFHEWVAPELHWGALPATELMLRSSLSGWDEARDHFTLFDQNHNYLVKDENRLAHGMASQRHDNVARVDLGGKLELLGGHGGATTSFAPALKIPIAREGDLTGGGTWDVGATLLETIPLDAFTLHANGGWVWPLGHQNLFEDSEHVGINSFPQGALGVNWLANPDVAFLLQLQANGSAFRDIEFLNEAPVTLTGGSRCRFGTGFVELSGGRGFSRNSADTWEMSVAFGLAF